MAEISDEFRKKMSEWVELKKQLTDVRKDVKVLTDKEKELRTYIQGYMKEKEIDNVNLKKGKVSLKTRQKTSSLSKKAVEAGLHTYFQGDEVKVEGAMTCITDSLERSETSSISLTGIKEKD